MLNFEFYGKDFKYIVSAFFADSILGPPMEPDLSSKKINSNFLLVSFWVSSKGEKTVKHKQFLPIVHKGVAGFYLQYENSRSISGSTG